jgi:hypothetical protein
MVSCNYWKQNAVPYSQFVAIWVVTLNFADSCAVLSADCCARRFEDIHFSEEEKCEKIHHE